MNKIKVLNLYCGIGGNRKLWQNVEVTAIENNEKIAEIYGEFFPLDKVIVCNAHDYLIDNFKDFDFIWSSPPCTTHSRLQHFHKKKVYLDMSLYQEIILLREWFKGKWLVENVIPYYPALIAPNFYLGRHFFWSNFAINSKYFDSISHNKKPGEKEYLQNQLNFDVSKFKGIDQRKILRNCVDPALGEYIFNQAFEMQQQSSFFE